MYNYKFVGRKLVHTLIADAPPDGYVCFAGNPLAGADGYVDWTAVDSDGLTLSAKPRSPEPAPYVPTLEEVKSQRKEYIKQRRNQEEARSPFEYDNSLFDYDPLSRERINSAVLGSTIAAVSGVEPNTVVANWRLWDNTTRDMTVADWMGFKQAEIARSAECFSIASGLKSDIEAAPDVSAVNLIDWPSGNDSIIFGNNA